MIEDCEYRLVRFIEEMMGVASFLDNGGTEYLTVQHSVPLPQVVGQSGFFIWLPDRCRPRHITLRSARTADSTLRPSAHLGRIRGFYQGDSIETSPGRWYRENLGRNLPLPRLGGHILTERPRALTWGRRRDYPLPC